MTDKAQNEEADPEWCSELRALVRTHGKAAVEISTSAARIEKAADKWVHFAEEVHEMQRVDLSYRYYGQHQDRRRGIRIDRRGEAWGVGVLIILAVLGYVIAYLALRGALEDSVHSHFNPSDTAQIVTAAGGLLTAVGVSVAGVIKAVALLTHARADMLRARSGLPPGGDSSHAEPDDPAG